MAEEEQCFGVEQAREFISDPRYTIDEFIGSGAMACVYKARERGTPYVYALKLLREKYRQRPQFLEIFEREAIHMRDLQYPNIVRFYKFVAEDLSAYILMDYVEGKPLTHYIQEARNNNNPMPIAKIVRLMAQIARAIAYLHAEGYIHRDIKPGNVLLAGEDESAFLTDLGIAGAFDMQDGLGGAGTPSYMPYEQQINGELDHTVDIYAFGVMLFELFTGRKPFTPEKGLSFQEARRAIIELHRKETVPSIVELRPELPEVLDEIFAQALAKKPADRYRDIMDFAQDLHEALLSFLPPDMQDFEAIRPQAISRSANPEIIEISSAQPRTVLFGGIAALIVIILLVIAGLWYNSSMTSPTSVASLTNTNSEIALNTESLSPSPEANSSASPTGENTIEISPTAFLTDENLFIIATNSTAIGLDLGDSLSETVATVLREEASPFVFLRIWPSLNSFYVLMDLEPESLDNYTSYGIAFRMRDHNNYARLRVEPATMTWFLESIEAGEVQIIQEHPVEKLPSRLLASGIDNIYRFEVDEEVISYTNSEWRSNSTSLYIEIDSLERVAIDSLSIGVLGTDADFVLRETPTYVPPNAPYQYLLDDINRLKATGDASAIVQCPDFVTIYESLERHSQSETMRPYVETAQSLSAFIYSRCLVEDGAVDFNDSYSDYLEWEDSLENLADDISDLRYRYR